MVRWMVCGVALVALTGCDDDDGRFVRGHFDPPTEPEHDEVEDGSAHARGLETPFLCKDPNGRVYGPCPDDLRPERVSLSCDASGCHGDYTFEPGIDPDSRHLLGSDGPSCYACHDKEWSSQKDGVASDGDDR